MSGTGGFITRYPAKETASLAVSSSQTTAPGVPYQYATATSHSGPRNKLQITPEVASRTLEPMIAAQLRIVGFQGSESNAMESFQNLCVQLVSHLAALAQEYATLSNRAMPHAKDMLAACDDCGIDVTSLYAIVKGNRRTKRKPSNGYERPRALIVVAPPAPPKPDELLPSDSEPEEKDETPLKSKDDAQEPKGVKVSSSSHPRSLQSLPNHFPKMPPKHTYLRTDPPPPVTTSLSSLQQKINNAAIIQDSLRNLIQATEAPAAPRDQDAEDDIVQTNQPVPPGLVGLVNWEAASGVRRPLSRWKV